MKNFFKKIGVFALVATLQCTNTIDSAICPNSLVSYAETTDDVIELGSISVTENTVLKLTDGQVYHANDISITDGKDYTIKGGGTLYADSISGGVITIQSGTIYCDTISAGTLGDVVINGGKVTANTITGGSGTGSGSSSYGRDVLINGGTVVVKTGIYGGDAGISGTYGGSVQILNNANVEVNGEIVGGAGSNKLSGDSCNGISVGSLAGGDVTIASPNAKINGKIQGGIGGAYYKYTSYQSINASGKYYYFYGSNGGNVHLLDGNYEGTVTVGKALVPSSGYKSTYPGSNGRIEISGGVFIGDIDVAGASTGLYSRNDGTAYIESDSIPSRESFISGIINCSGEVDVCGSQTLNRDLSLDSYDTLTINDSSSLSIENCTLNIDGNLINKGTLILGENSCLKGEGAVTGSDSAKYTIKNLTEDMIILPSNPDYDGKTDYSAEIQPSADGELYVDALGGIVFNTEHFTRTLLYRSDKESEFIETDTAVKAGEYIVRYTDIADSDNIVEKVFSVYANYSASVSAHNLILGEDIGVKFYFEFADDVLANETSTIRFTVNGRESGILVSEADLTSYGYEFICPVVAAEINDTITAQLYVDDKATGDPFYYSVKTYADYILEHSAEYAEEAPLVNAMLNYGAAPEKYFRGSTALNFTNPDVDASVISRYKFTVNDNDSAIDYMGQVISLKNKVTAKLYFSGSKLTVGDFRVTQNGVAVESSRLTVGSDTNGTYLAISGIAANEMSAPFEISVGGVTISNYSVFSYVQGAINSSTDGLADVVAALYAYGCAAENYSTL